MKPRTPKSFVAALTKVMTSLSDDRCAEIVGRSPSLIRKWADPDHPSLPSLYQAMALDIVYTKSGYGEPPILKAYEEILEDTLGQRDDDPVDIVMAALAVQGTVGSLSEAIREALDPKGPGGAVITPRERQQILEIIDRLEDHTDDIETAVDEND